MGTGVDRWAVWNTLHDGVIVAAEGSVPGELVLSVEIGYLCKMLATAADHLTLRLLGCTSLRVKPYEDLASTDTASLIGLEILDASEGADGMVVVNSVHEVIELKYREASIQIAEGDKVTQSQLEDAAERYWSEWEAKHKH